MVEKANTCERHCNAIFIAGLYDIVVTHGATSLSNVLNTTLVSTLDVVAEGEERI